MEDDDLPDGMLTQEELRDMHEFAGFPAPADKKAENENSDEETGDLHQNGGYQDPAVEDEAGAEERNIVAAMGQYWKMYSSYFIPCSWSNDKSLVPAMEKKSRRAYIRSRKI